MKVLFEAESADIVNVSNCYLTYDNEGDINVDVYNTDGLAEVLWEAVNEGGISIEQLK